MSVRAVADGGPEPMLADVVNNAGVCHVIAGILGRRSKFRRLQVLAAETVQRQTAVAAEVEVALALAVPTLLSAVERPSAVSRSNTMRIGDLR